MLMAVARAGEIEMLTEKKSKIVLCFVVWAAFPESDGWVMSYRMAKLVHGRFQSKLSCTRNQFRGRCSHCQLVMSEMSLQYNLPSDIKELEHQLKIAVEQERYGDAARLRDIIRAGNSERADLQDRPISFWHLQRKGASIDPVREKCQVLRFVQSAMGLWIISGKRIATRAG